MKFCTWDHSCAVVACAKYYSNMIPYNGATLNKILLNLKNDEKKFSWNGRLDWQSCTYVYLFFIFLPPCMHFTPLAIDNSTMFWCQTSRSWCPGIILCMHPANERRRYNVTSSLTGWVHAQNDPWNCQPIIHCDALSRCLRNARMVRWWECQQMLSPTAIKFLTCAEHLSPPATCQRSLEQPCIEKYEMAGEQASVKMNKYH